MSNPTSELAIAVGGAQSNLLKTGGMQRPAKDGSEVDGFADLLDQIDGDEQADMYASPQATLPAALELMLPELSPGGMTGYPSREGEAPSEDCVGGEGSSAEPEETAVGGMQRDEVRASVFSPAPVRAEVPSSPARPSFWSADHLQQRASVTTLVAELRIASPTEAAGTLSSNMGAIPGERSTITSLPAEAREVEIGSGDENVDEPATGEPHETVGRLSQGLRDSPKGLAVAPDAPRATAERSASRDVPAQGPVSDASVPVVVLRQETHVATSRQVAPEAIMAAIGDQVADLRVQWKPEKESLQIVRRLDLEVQPPNSGTIKVRMSLMGQELGLVLEVTSRDLSLHVERERETLGRLLQSTGLSLESLVIQVSDRAGSFETGDLRPVQGGRGEALGQSAGGMSEGGARQNHQETTHRQPVRKLQTSDDGNDRALWIARGRPGGIYL